MVAAASAPKSPHGDADLGEIMRAELRAGARRVLVAWNDVLSCVRLVAEKAEAGEVGVEKDSQHILSATGVVWESCDALLTLCNLGVVGLVVRKAEEWRGVLLDAVQELKEWGEDVQGDEDEEEDGGFRSGGENDDDDDIFGAANKLGKGDEELKALLDRSVKRLKMVGVLYAALVKRRLKPFPFPFQDGMATLDHLMSLLKSIPESVDDLASAFYDLDSQEAKALLKKCCDDAARAAEMVRIGWEGGEDEFTVWSGKWRDAMAVS